MPWAIAGAAWVLCALVTEDGSRTSGLISDPQYLVKHGLYAVVILFLLVPAVFGDRSGVGAVRRFLAPGARCCTSGRSRTRCTCGTSR